MKNLTIAELRALIAYDPESGGLTWRWREASTFRSGLQKEERRWNARYAGEPALASKSAGGYLQGAVHKRPIFAHVVAWAIYHGKWADGEIDHINGDRADNRMANLREVSAGENQKNRARPLNNTSGHIGVSYNRRDKRWTAYIGLGGRHVFIGNFHALEEAVAARAAAAARHGFHENHGRAAL